MRLPQTDVLEFAHMCKYEFYFILVAIKELYNLLPYLSNEVFNLSAVRSTRLLGNKRNRISLYSLKIKYIGHSYDLCI